MVDPRKVNIANLPFESLQNRHRLPDTGGIYFLFEVDESDGLTPIYIGQSGSIRSRWKRHEVMHELLATKDYEIAYLEMADGDRLAVESYFITEWNPPLNTAFSPKRMWLAGMYGATPHPDLLAARQRKNRPL